jgi:hypothetical protein
MENLLEGAFRLMKEFRASYIEIRSFQGFILRSDCSTGCSSFLQTPLPRVKNRPGGVEEILSP